MRGGQRAVQDAAASAPASTAGACPQEQLHFRCPVAERIGPVTTTVDDAFLVAGGRSGKLYVWEVSRLGASPAARPHLRAQLSSGELLNVLDAHYKAITCLQFSSDGALLYSGGDDAVLHAWPLAM